MGIHGYCGFYCDKTLKANTVLKTTVQDVSAKMRWVFLLRDRCVRLHVNADLSVVQKHPKNLCGSADTEGSGTSWTQPSSPFIFLKKGNIGKKGDPGVLMWVLGWRTNSLSNSGVVWANWRIMDLFGVGETFRTESTSIPRTVKPTTHPCH